MFRKTVECDCDQFYTLMISNGCEPVEERLTNHSHIW